MSSHAMVRGLLNRIEYNISINHWFTGPIINAYHDLLSYVQYSYYLPQHSSMLDFLLTTVRLKN